MGPHYSSIREEVADPEHRDGLSAVLDDEQHQEGVQREVRRRQEQQERQEP